MSKITNDGLTRSDTGCYVSIMTTVGVKWLIQNIKLNIFNDIEHI